jgi:hypothetical protein
LIENQRTKDVGTVDNLERLWGSTPPKGPNHQATDGDEDDGQEPLVNEFLHGKNQPLHGDAARVVEKGYDRAQFNLNRFYAGNNQIRSMIFRFFIFRLIRKSQGYSSGPRGRCDEASRATGWNVAANSDSPKFFCFSPVTEVRSMV